MVAIEFTAIADTDAEHELQLELLESFQKQIFILLLQEFRMTERGAG